MYLQDLSTLSGTWLGYADVPLAFEITGHSNGLKSVHLTGNGFVPAGEQNFKVERSNLGQLDGDCLGCLCWLVAFDVPIIFVCRHVLSCARCMYYLSASWRAVVKGSPSACQHIFIK